MVAQHTVSTILGIGLAIFAAHLKLCAAYNDCEIVDINSLRIVQLLNIPSIFFM